MLTKNGGEKVIQEEGRSARKFWVQIVDGASEWVVLEHED